MAYVIKYYYEYYDIGKTKHRVELLELDYSGGSTHIEEAESPYPVRMRHTGSKTDFEETIIQGQELVFSFYVSRADADTFDALFESDYKDWKVKYYVDEDSDGPMLVFEGYVKPENLSKQYSKNPPYMQITLSATDALADLKNVDFLDSDGSPVNDILTILEILKHALTPTGIEFDFQVQLGTYESNYMDSTDCALEEMQIDTRRFFIERTGKREYMSCFDVIEAVLKDFNVTFKQYKGQYQITCHHELNSRDFLYDWTTLIASSASPVAVTNIVDITDYEYDPIIDEQKVKPLETVGVAFRNKDLGGDVTGLDLDDWADAGVWTIDFSNLYSVVGIVVELKSDDNTYDEYIETAVFNVAKVTDEDYLKITFDHVLDSYTAPVRGIDAPEIKITITRPDSSTKDFYFWTFSNWNTFESSMHEAFRVIATGNYKMRLSFKQAVGTWTTASFKMKAFTISKVINSEEGELLAVTYDQYYEQTSNKGIEIFKTETLIADSGQITEVGALLYDDSGVWKNTALWRTYGHTEDIALLDVYARYILDNRYDYKNYLRLKISDRNNNIGFDNILTIQSKNYVFISYDRDFQGCFITADLVELLTTQQSYGNIILTNLNSINGEQASSSVNISYMTPGSLPSHNAMSGLYGDSPYYHLSSADYTNVGNLDTMAYEATGSYYTKTELLTDGALDPRYYTETEVDDWRNSVTQTEMGYLHGVSSDIQTQITARVIIGANPADNRIATWTNATTLQGETNFVCLANGNVGIGTATPTKLSGDGGRVLHIVAPDDAVDNPEIILERLKSGTKSKASLRITDSKDFRIAVQDGEASVIDAFTILSDTGDVLFDSNIGTDNYVSETTGWRGNYAGQFDVRRLFTDQLIAKAFIADIDLALLSGHMVSKSVTQVSRDFTVPATSNTGTLYVEAIPGFPTSQVFADGDWIRLQVIDRTGGGLIHAVVWATTASFVDDGDGEQHYTITIQDDGGVSTEKVYAGAAAQDFGQSGDGFIQQEAGYGTHRPWLQVATWVTDPSVGANITVRSRLGNLAGITGQSGFGLVTRKDDDNYVAQWWNTDSDWGIRGNVGGDEVFRLGNINKIAGWTISNTALTGGADATTIALVPGTGIHLGNAVFADSPFRVSNAGVMVARKAVLGTAETGDRIEITGSHSIDFYYEAEGVPVLEVSSIAAPGKRPWITMAYPLDTDYNWILLYDSFRYFGKTGSSELKFYQDRFQFNTKVNVTVDLATDFATYFFNNGNDPNRYGIGIQCGLDTIGEFVNYPARFFDGNGSLKGYIWYDNTEIDIAYVSDIRLKEDIKDYNIDGLNIIRQMQYRSFNLKNDPDKLEIHGWIADEIEKFFPEMVLIDLETGLKTISKGKLIPIIVATLKQNDERIKQLESKN